MVLKMEMVAENQRRVLAFGQFWFGVGLLGPGPGFKALGLREEADPPSSHRSPLISRSTRVPGPRKLPRLGPASGN